MTVVPWQVTDLGKTFEDIGEGNWLSSDGITDGYWWAHNKPDGTECGMGQINFPPWGLVNVYPLTVEGSLLCGNCGRHGFVRDGKWVEA